MILMIIEEGGLLCLAIFLLARRLGIDGKTKWPVIIIGKF